LVNDQGYLEGAPELIAEVAASSASLDAHQKFQTYRRAGVREYLLWRTVDGQLDWWVLERDEFRPLPLAADGSIRSRTFPGLWLDWRALLERDGAKVLSMLQEGIASSEHAAFVEQLRVQKRP
jgi:Uma2 family endonuclease